MESMHSGLPRRCVNSVGAGRKFGGKKLWFKKEDEKLRGDPGKKKRNHMLQLHMAGKIVT